MRQVTIVDGETVFIDANEECKHPSKTVISTSESGSNTCYVHYYCRGCKASFTDELLPAQYESLLEQEYGEDFREKIL